MADVTSKAEKMRRKTEEMRRTFNLPDTETAVQDYACAYKGRIQGRMFVSQNYVSFHAALPETVESIPYRKITNIEKDYTALVFNTAITITTQTGPYFFGAFVHRDETLNLLLYLWKNPPSYVDVDDGISPDPVGSQQQQQQQRPSSSSATSSSSSSPSASNPFEYGEGRRSAEAGRVHSSGSSSNSQQQQLYTAKVDTETTRNALRIATEAREIGAATMNELSYQAEVIDLIERDVEHVHNNLDKADRLVRGIESFGGHVANAFSSQKKGKELGYIDRTLTFTREDPPVDIDILRKLSNDNLTPAVLRITSDKFMCLNPTTKKPEKDCTFTFENVDSIVIRARHLHLDIRFRDKTPRFRMFTSYIQAVVNELVLRLKSKIGDARVVFEPGTKKFAYGSASITPPVGPSNGGERKVAFFRKDGAPAPVNPLIKNAPDGMRQDLMKQEEDLDSISNILGDLHGIATTMGGELTRQTEQLNHVSKRVDQAGERMHRTNQRIDRIG